MSKNMKQTSLFRGVYEFDDPSGVLLGARVPQEGSVDLYDGTVVVVRPSQCAIFIYKGEIADFFGPGTHTLSTGNLPILTRLANWKLGFNSPLRAELYFFSGSLFTSRRWGTSHPILHKFSQGNVNLRAFGNYNVRIVDPKKLLLSLMGSRSLLSITDVDELIQGHLIETFPSALEKVTELSHLSKSQKEVSSRLEKLLAPSVSGYGLSVASIQVLSLLPPKDVIQAMDTRTAMDVIGDKREFLFYKAANSLDVAHESGSKDPLQLMMGMMLGKGIMGVDYHEKERKPVSLSPSVGCKSCGVSSSSEYRFCPQCGKEMKP